MGVLALASLLTTLVLTTNAYRIDYYRQNPAQKSEMFMVHEDNSAHSADHHAYAVYPIAGKKPKPKNNPNNQSFNKYNIFTKFEKQLMENKYQDFNNPHTRPKKGINPLFSDDYLERGYQNAQGYKAKEAGKGYPVNGYGFVPPKEYSGEGYSYQSRNYKNSFNGYNNQNRNNYKSNLKSVFSNGGKQLNAFDKYEYKSGDQFSKIEADEDGYSGYSNSNEDNGEYVGNNTPLSKESYSKNNDYSQTEFKKDELLGAFTSNGSPKDELHSLDGNKQYTAKAFGNEMYSFEGNNQQTRKASSSELYTFGGNKQNEYKAFSGGDENNLKQFSNMNNVNQDAIFKRVLDGGNSFKSNVKEVNQHADSRESFELTPEDEAYYNQEAEKKVELMFKNNLPKHADSVNGASSYIAYKSEASPYAEHEDAAEVHYHKHKHVHKHNHVQDHKHNHEQEHIHAHIAQNQHDHKHEEDHKHDHDNKHNHAHKHQQQHSHNHQNEHKHTHAHKEAHQENHKHNHAEDHKHEHQHGNKHAHNHDHHSSHKHDHHHGHKESHYGEHKHDHHHGHKHSHKSEHQHGHKHGHKHGHEDKHMHGHKHGHMHGHKKWN